MKNQEFNYKPLEVKQLVNNSLTLYKNNFKYLFLLGVIGGIGFSINEYIRFFYKGALIGGVSSVIANLLFGWTVIMLVLASWKLLNDEKISIQESLSSASNSFIQFILSQILYFLLVIVGFILLIVPGLYLGTIFTFACIPIVLEQKNVIEGFKISKNLIKGYFWVILLIGISVMAISGAVYFISGLFGSLMKVLLYGIFTALIVPYLSILEVSIYKEIKAIKQT